MRPGRVVIEISTSDHGEQFSHNDIIYEYIEEGAVVAIVRAKDLKAAALW